jgi:RNA polymerase sigma factor (TIGR02999 family)
LSDPKTITRLLHRCRDDASSAAFEELIPLVYDDLRHLARKQLQRLRPGQTLDTTGLAHESYLKLRDHVDLDWNDRNHFYAVSACAMRQILVDYARSRMTQKRDGVEVEIDLERAPVTPEEHASQLLHVNELVRHLETIDADLARVVESRYFAGFTEAETAEILGISTRTAQRRWRMAKGFLRELARQPEYGGS